MKRLVVICVIAVVLLGLAGAGQARIRRGRAGHEIKLRGPAGQEIDLRGPVVVCVPDCPVEPVKPFIAMSITPDELDLGYLARSGPGGLSGELTAHIVANCPYNMEVSFAPFTGKSGPILPKHTSLVINGREIAVNGQPVSIASSSKPTPVKGVDVRVNLEVTVDMAFLYQAGAYKGDLTFTLMPGC